MSKGQIIVESSTFDGAMEMISKITDEYSFSGSTLPMRTHDGRYVALVHYSMAEPARNATTPKAYPTF